MNEDSLRFWIIPIISLITIAFIFSFTVDYKINVVLPNAEIERNDMKNMLCPEILIKDSFNNYWSPENSKMGRSMSEVCKELMKPESSGLSPYVEFCVVGGFAPIKIIKNNTHSFNHDTCVWGLK